jgi:glycine cleavage system regulatory protein
MNKHLVLTVVGDDRPGLVGELAATISGHGGNWLQSSMAQLAGQFAGIVEVAVAAEKVAELRAALNQLAHLKVVVAEADPKKSALAGRHTRKLKLALVGHDRVGIVREVSQVLARFAVNVENLATHTASAPMSADILFHADAELTAGPELDARALIDALELLSNDLMVDIALDESIRRN